MPDETRRCVGSVLGEMITFNLVDGNTRNGTLRTQKNAPMSASGFIPPADANVAAFVSVFVAKGRAVGQRDFRSNRIAS